VADARIRWLVGLAGALAVVRFAVVPWVQAQNEQRQQLELLTKRLDRSEGVIQNREAIVAARDALRQESEASFAAFPVAVGDDDSRLAAQQRITAMAAQAGLQVSLFDWLLDGEASEAGLAYSRASIKIDGPLDRLILMHGDLESSLPFAAVREFQLKLKSPTSGPNADPASAVVVLDLFYQPKPPSALQAGGPS
jgi:hypothetical protein